MPLELPSPPRIIIFDFDGVILNSAGIKLNAYARIYESEDPEKVEAVVQHAEYHGGITRRVKFNYYEREIFGREGDAASVDVLCRRYFDVVYEDVLRCPFIEGAQELLEQAYGKVRMHVISGTPDNELNQVVRDRRLVQYFQTVRGSPSTKRERFEQIVVEENCQRKEVLAIGDSMTEFEAARDACIPFLGIIPADAENPFPATTAVWPTLRDADVKLNIR